MVYMLTTLNIYKSRLTLYIGTLSFFLMIGLVIIIFVKNS